MYRVTINGKSYDLPARTLVIDEKIEEMGTLDKKYTSGEMTRREVVQAQFDFVQAVAPGAFEDVENADTNDILKACLDIINEYNKPVYKAKADSDMCSIKDMINRPEFQKLLLMAQLNK